MMPKLDGFSATKEIRKTKQTPIIILSARVEEYDKLHGFEMGADDYVTKPFSPKELMARAAAIMRRGAINEDKMVSGDLTIDFAGCAVFIAGKRVPMTPKECRNSSIATLMRFMCIIYKEIYCAINAFVV